jgi:hypothetical protein
VSAIEVHHICLADHAKDVLDRYAKQHGKTVDEVLEDIVNVAVEEIATSVKFGKLET